jgi:hypothetical protein
MRIFLLPLILISILSGCYSSQSIPNRVKISPVAKAHCDSNAKLTHFFSYTMGEKIDFNYQNPLLVRSSSSDSSQTILIDVLKMRAAKECADGIINITPTTSEKHTKKDTAERLDKTPIYSYTGLAVRLLDTATPIRMDHAFVKRYNRYIDKKYQKAKQIDDCKECDAKRGSKGLIIAGSCLAILFGILVLVSK